MQLLLKGNLATGHAKSLAREMARIRRFDTEENTIAIRSQGGSCNVASTHGAGL